MGKEGGGGIHRARYRFWRDVDIFGGVRGEGMFRVVPWLTLDGWVGGVVERVNKSLLKMLMLVFLVYSF